MRHTDVPRSNDLPTRRNPFFFWMSVLLLVAVLAGFVPTFFLRPLFDDEPLRWHLVMHGAVLTAWFAWFVLQTWLVQTGRVSNHRRLGLVGAAIGAACVFGGPTATATAIRSLLDRGLTWDSKMSEYPALGIESLTLAQYGPSLVFGNVGSTLLFAGLLAIAVRHRHRADTHKRLMLLASINFISPAFARLSRLPGWGGEDGLLIPVMFIALLLALVVYDRRTLGRVHPATARGIAATFVVMTAAIGLSQTPWGMAVTKSLG
jgi:hypothetical protein